MKTKIDLSSIKITDHIHSQWDALDIKGNYVYISYNHGTFIVGKSKTKKDYFRNKKQLLFLDISEKDDLMSTKEMIEILINHDLLEVKDEKEKESIVFLLSYQQSEISVIKNQIKDLELLLSKKFKEFNSSLGE